MKVSLPLTFLLLPLMSNATGSPASECAAPGHYAESMLQASIKNDLGLDLSAIPPDKIIVEVLSVAPVSAVFARQMAKTDSATKGGLSEKEYYEIYQENNVMNLTVRYAYTSANNKQNIFITSALINNDECSVRYNGWMTVARAF